jgi:glycosyltransferase involved in cell wall biosynthesis
MTPKRAAERSERGSGAPREVTHVLALAERPGRVVWAGAERHLRLLLPALARHGADVEAIVLATDPGPSIEQGLREWRDAGVRVEVLARRGRGSRWVNAPGFVAQHVRLWRALCARRERTVHLHLDLVFMVVAAFAARCRRVVVTLHNEVVVPRARAGRYLARAWLRRVAARLAGCIAISPRVAEHFRALSACPAEKIAIVPYGLDLGPPAPASRAQRGWPSDRFLVGFVGRLVAEKNVFVLLEAMAACPEIDAVLVGDGPLRREVESWLATRGIDNVRLEGAVENASSLIPLFDVLCLPSRWEGLGLVLVEAMLQGVPVIGSRGGAIPDVLGEGCYGVLFDTDDPRDLARALRHAHRVPLEMRALAERAQAYARERFSVERMVERTVAVYAEAGPRIATRSLAVGWS